MIETYEMHGTVITIKPRGHGCWRYETFHRELCMFGQGEARSKASAKSEAEASALALETNKAKIQNKLSRSRIS